MKSHNLISRYKHDAGFTIIELVVVIALIGILSAIALPRFIDISDDARYAKLRSLEGTMKSTIALIKAKAVVDGVDKQASSTVLIDGQSIAISYGYPLGTTNSLVAAMQLSSDKWKQQASVVYGSWIFWDADSSYANAWGSQCYVQYYKAANAATPGYTKLVDGNC